MKIFKLLLILLFCSSVWSSCDKKPEEPEVPPPPVCSLTLSQLAINEVVDVIKKDTSYATANNTYYTEHTISVGEGVSFDFPKIVIPAEGEYTVTKVYTDVKPTTKYVYIQYYHAGDVYIAQSGNVTVSGFGIDIVIEFCKLVFRNSGGDELTISFKSDLK
ncbi:MAG: hypothetical protein JNJ58_06485 [Chitinophagaceae bacterium]|nr:hypothetical protein [Chitinophagaceae bacterium]